MSYIMSVLLEFPITIKMDGTSQVVPIDSGAPESVSDWWVVASTLFTTLWTSYPMIAGLITLMILDIGTGLAKGVMLSEIDSKVSRRGMYQKVMMLAVVAAAWLTEMLFPKVGGVTMPWGQIVAGFFLVVEVISIIENAGKAGVPIPKSFMDALARYKETEKPAPLISMNVNANDAHIDNQADSKTRMEIHVDKPIDFHDPANTKAMEKVIKHNEDAKEASEKANQIRDDK